MALTATRLLDNYIDGEWTPAQAATGELDVLNPATGEVLARVPLSGSADLDVAVRAAREALPEWRAVSTIARARKLFELRERLVARQEDLARSVTTEMGKTIADARAEVARMIEMVEAACAIPTTMQGRCARGRLAEHRCRDDPSARRRVRGDRPVQLPGDGPVLVPPVRDRVRQHVRVEAFRAGPADSADRVRGAPRVGVAARRGESGQWEPGCRGGDPRSPRDRRGVVRRVGAGGADRLRARGQGGQAGAGARGRQEPHGRDARRRDRQDRRRDHRLSVRRGRSAVHGRVGGGDRRRRARAADAVAGRDVACVAGRRWVGGGKRRRTGDLVRRTRPDPRLDRAGRVRRGEAGARRPRRPRRVRTARTSGRRSWTTCLPRRTSPRRRCSVRSCA